MLALLGAIREEADCLLNKIEHLQVLRSGGSLAHLWRGHLAGREVLLGLTGIGKRQAETAGRYILENFEITYVVSFGFCGALTDRYRVGEVVMCNELMTISELPLLRADWKILQGWEAPHCRGVTVDRPVTVPADKKKLGIDLQADIVDMESYWIGSLARAREVPFTVVRSVTDGQDDRLPDFGRFLRDNGTVRIGGAIRYFLAHPMLWGPTLGLRKKIEAARNSLTGFLIAAMDCF